ncbi:MAG: cytochrome d ubiquinol oxidase subunit II [Deltaproteobacteria bacterium RBG_16_49_23]|nr:MAG: cytochrome d ubiquinol oxidase subunit II [Deltaproteobacteria bacterium RBG_16_49_23]
MDLNTILFSLVGALVVGYAILDGFDLGVGMLSLFARSKEERDLHVASIGPVWDGNEVWLLAVGDVLFGAFPLVFTTVFSGFYLAFMVLLVALVARAVAIEFRLLHPRPLWIRFWDFAFGLGSFASAFLLGVAFGNLVRGVPIGPGFAWKGTFLGLLNPYALLIGIVTCVLLLMHGALYLWMKTEGELSDRLSRIAIYAYSLFLLLYGVATAATVFVSPFLFRKAGGLVFWGLPVLLAMTLASIPFIIRTGRKGAAFLASSVTIALIIIVVASSAYPVLVPSSQGPQLSLTIYNAASTRGTLMLMLVIALVGIPIMLAYTFAVYRVFRGPTRTAAY